jgi:hypothetical protein
MKINMVKLEDIYSGNYLNVELVKKNNLIDKVLIIIGTTTEEIQGKNKLVVVLEGVEELFVPNKTNAYIIAEKLGNDTESWKGKGIKFSLAKVMLNGKMIPSIMVKEVIEKPTI